MPQRNGNTSKHPTNLKLFLCSAKYERVKLQGKKYGHEDHSNAFAKCPIGMEIHTHEECMEAGPAAGGYDQGSIGPSDSSVRINSQDAREIQGERRRWESNYPVVEEEGTVA
jgi:hypothetical protein